MQLTPRQERALKAICDTFAAGDKGVPSASQLGVPEAVTHILDRIPRAVERNQLALLLSLWDSSLLGLLSGAGFNSFSEMPLRSREQVLEGWRDSGLSQRRAAYHALRKATLLLYYALPGPRGGKNPLWGHLHYPGPAGAPANPAPRAIQPLRIDRDTHLDCDVCVVGSGAGGGAAAGVLAAAGLDVVVLEAGGYFDDADFDGGELAGLNRLYMQGGTSATADQGIILLAGECLGGGTVVNYCTSFRTPQDVREEWAAHGVPQFAAETYTRSLDAVCERLHVNTDHNQAAKREQMMRRGLEKLGWHCDRMPRNVRGCEQGVRCGYCGYGCAIGAKQSTVKTWLADAHARGARIVVNTFADRVRIEMGAACGVDAVHRETRSRVTVRAKSVVSACGTIHTPPLLRRSGLTNPNIGRHLHLHPVTAVWGEFDEEIRPWEGTLQAFYSDQFRHLTGAYGLKIETTAEHPSLAAAFFPWFGSWNNYALTLRLKNMVGLGVLLRDRDAGRVDTDRHGHPVTHYALSKFDVNHMRIGVRGAAQILEATGAKLIFTSHARYVSYEPGRRGSLEQFCRDADACGWRAGQCGYASFHIMGTARMGGSAKSSACNPEGQTWDTRNLYVCDAATFPSASGVNPMISIEAIAHMNARALAAHLAR